MDLKWLFFKNKDFFFVEIIFWSCRWLSKNIYSVFFCSLSIFIYFFEGFLRIFSMLIKKR